MLDSKEGIQLSTQHFKLKYNFICVFVHTRFKVSCVQNVLWCTGCIKCLVIPCIINTTHNVKYACSKKLNLLYFQTSLVIKFVKLNFVYLQRF